MRSAVFVIVAAVAAMAYALAIIVSEGEPLLLAAPLALLIVGVLLARPVAGVYLLLGAGILLEQWPIAGLDPITAQSHIFENISNYTPLPLRVSLADLLVLTAVFSWAARVAVRTAPPLRRGPADLAVALYAAVFLFGLGVGIARGGSWDLGAALAELRGPAYLATLYLLSSQLIRTRRQILVVALGFVVLTGVKAVEGIGNYVQMLSSPRWLDAVTGHEDVVFFDAVIGVALVALVLIPKKRLTLVLVSLLPFLLIVDFLSQRRVAFVALGAALAVASVLLIAARPRRTVVLLASIAIAASAYGAAMWDQQGLLAQPVRAAKAVVAPDEVSDRDRMSDWWRDIENGNIANTIRQLPLTGVGLGQEYLFVQEPPQLDGFVYWRYWTHNAVFWVYLKAGPIGFFALWLLCAQALMTSGRLFARLRDDELRTIAALVGIAVVSQIVYSSVDLGLTFSRPMIVLGTLLGLLTPLALLVKVNGASRSASAAS